MTPEQYQRVEEVFSVACTLPPSSRRAYVEEHCADDAVVRAEVDAMLAADEGEGRSLSSIALPRPGDETRVDASDRARAESIPERVGRYRIVRECGHGGMGVVYEAEQENPSRRVALKVIRTGLVSRDLLRRFRNETEVLGRLQHPGIAQIFEAGSSASESMDGDGDEHGGPPYIAMEFVDGAELLDHARSRALSPRAKLRLFALVCDAVQHAHERGVVHRDLKPANILVVPPGTGAPADDVGRPKVLDFGVARMTGADRQVTTLLTQAGALVGTLQYMSPEQASEGRLPVDARSDVYSLGVVLYELLAGRPPHDLAGLTIPESVVVIRERDARRIGAVEPRFAGDVDTILGKCLEKEPERRYASAAELAKDIRRHLGNQPISARPPSAWYQAKRFARRHRVFAAGVLTTALALVIGTVTSLVFALRTLDSEAAALRRAYTASLTAAQALTSTDPLLAKQQLAAAPVELRSWEWWYLSSRLQRYSRTFEESLVPDGPRAHVKRSVDVEFTADGAHVVGALADGRIGVWNPRTAELWSTEATLAGSTIRALDVPNNGPPRVACGTWEGRVGIWDLDDHRWTDVVDGDDPIWFVAWDAEGERLLYRTRSSVYLWQDGVGTQAYGGFDALTADFADADSWAQFHKHHERPTELAFGPAGRHFFATVRTGKYYPAAIWDARTGERLDWDAPDAIDGFTVAEHLLRGTSIRSHARDRFAFESGLRSAVLLDAPSLEGGVALRGHRDGVYRIGWTWDDAQVLTSSFDGTVRRWDSRSGTLLDVVEADRASPLAIAPDGSGFVYRAGGELRFEDLADAQTVLEPNVSYVYAVAYSPDGDHLAVGSPYSRSVALFDARTGWALQSVETSEPSMDLYFPRHDVVASGPETFWVWNDSVVSGGVIVDEGWPDVERRGGLRINNGMVLGKDGRLLATTGHTSWIAGRRASVIDRETDETLFELEGEFWGVALSPEGDLLAVAREDPGRVEVWNIARRERIAELLAHGSHAYCVEFHPYTSRLATGGNDNTVRLWDTTTWEQVLELRGHTSYVMALDFSPDGLQLASGSGDTTVRVWDAMPRDERHREHMSRR